VAKEFAETENQEVFEKLNDYTLSVTNDFGHNSEADPEIRRIFNFKARNITTIYSMWYQSGMTSSQTIQNFSQLDSLDEVRDLHQRLSNMKGNPPPLPEPAAPAQKKELKL
jgi:hypothetical protein